jgi:hypothetical protein
VHTSGARGSVVVKALHYKPEGHTSICLIFPAVLGSGVNLVSNRNLYWKQKNKVSEEKSGDRHVRLITSLLSMSRFSRQCGSSTSHNPMSLSDLLTGIQKQTNSMAFSHQANYTD